MAGCAAECEVAEYLGAAGVCVNYTDPSTSELVFECVCPPGYWGRDDWENYDDCHVNKNVQRTLWYVVIGLASTAVVVALSAMIFLVWFWDLLPARMTTFASSSRTNNTCGASSGASTGSKESKGSKDDGSSKDEPSASSKRKTGASFGARKASMVSRTPTAMSRAQRKQHKKKRNSRRISLACMLLLLLWSGNIVIYAVPLLFDITRANRVWYQDCAAAFATNSLFVGLWFFFLVFYENLPSLRHYGKLFGVDSVLIRRPTIVRGMFFSRVIIINVVTFGLLFLLNAVGVDSPEQRRALDTAFLWWSCALCVDFTFSTLLMFSVFERLFRQLDKLSADALQRGVGSATDNSNFKKVRNTLSFLKVAVFVLVVPAAIFFAASAALPTMRRNIYLLLNVNLIVANVGVLVLFAVFVFAMRGTDERAARLNAANSVGSMTGENRVGPAVPSEFPPSSHVFVEDDYASDDDDQGESL